ncbi:uncharacterized protein ALTATR162_LOCUS9059 [Alternaria atra]|uniref:Uncharacterized protein n=1 Tax=Alternaria atra TaxID=119953 RepID=A0A8J2IDR9_9PLEO|nr:uncharacterized protein ALTATR162_LOCUS9059 [Alternaria atra]CAG5179152.1 unnamed protein product [Alternaria atra]
MVLLITTPIAHSSYIIRHKARRESARVPNTAPVTVHYYKNLLRLSVGSAMHQSNLLYAPPTHDKQSTCTPLHLA